MSKWSYCLRKVNQYFFILSKAYKQKACSLTLTFATFSSTGNKSYTANNFVNSLGNLMKISFCHRLMNFFRS